MFSFLKNNKQEPEIVPSSVVGCFGKLPIYDEFIRFNVNGGIARELDEWVQQGYSQHSRKAQIDNDSSKLHDYTYHFVFSGSSDGVGCVIGTIIGSEDKSRRQYPFVMFKTITLQEVNKVISSLPCLNHEYFEETLNLLSTDWSLQPISMLKKRVEALRDLTQYRQSEIYLQSEEKLFESLSKTQLWKEMFGKGAEIESPRFIETMKDLVQTVVRKNPLRTSWGIEIPLPSSENIYGYVSFWVRLVQNVLSDRGWKPQYIWGDVNNSHNQKLYIFFRPITPLFVSYLFGNRVDNGILINIIEESQGQHNVSQAAEHIGSLATDDNLLHAVDDWTDWSRK